MQVWQHGSTVIWPETAISYTIQDKKNLRELISVDLDVPIIFGARRFDEKNKKLYNSAFLLSENGYILILLTPQGQPPKSAPPCTVHCIGIYSFTHPSYTLPE